MPASLTEEELARLEALEARVTPTPWRSGNVDLDCIFVAATHDDRMGPERVLLRMNQHFNGYDLDAQFIAAMRNALPALLASARAVRNVEAAIRELRAEYRLGPVKRKDGTDTTPVDLPRHLLDRVETALTATTEPTGGEEKR